MEFGSMRVIIAGSRSTTLSDFSEGMVACPFLLQISTVISGTAKGADALGERYAELNDIPLFKYPANWDKHGKKAGYLRNIEMAENADALIAFWDGKSHGTNHMINIAKERNLQIFIHLNQH